MNRLYNKTLFLLIRSNCTFEHFADCCKNPWRKNSDKKYNGTWIVCDAQTCTKNFHDRCCIPVDIFDYFSLEHVKWYNYLSWSIFSRKFVFTYQKKWQKPYKDHDTDANHHETVIVLPKLLFNCLIFVKNLTHSIEIS